MTAKRDYGKIAWNLADGIVTHCLPAWFPRLSVIVYFIGLATTLAQRVLERSSSLAQI